VAVVSEVLTTVDINVEFLGCDR